MNYIINEYCPKCHQLTSSTVTTTEKEEKDDNGERFKIIINSYQCNKCSTFVRSENEKISIEY